MSLGFVVFSNINYLFIYDIILTAFRIILSTWLYNNPSPTYNILHMTIKQSTLTLPSIILPKAT